MDIVPALFDETLDLPQVEARKHGFAVDATAKGYEDIDALQRRIFEGLLK